MSERPTCRSQCKDVPRPCPYVSCRYHLYLDIQHNGTLRINFKQPVWQLPASCALDVAEGGEVSTEGLAELIGCSRQGAEKWVQQGMSRLEKVIGGNPLDDAAPACAFAEHPGPPPRGRKLTGADEEAIVALGQGNLSRKALAERFGVSPSTIVDVLKRAGVPLKSRCKYSQGLVDEVYATYQREGRQRTLQKYPGVSLPAVLRRIRERKRRPPA